MMASSVHREGAGGSPSLPVTALERKVRLDGRSRAIEPLTPVERDAQLVADTLAGGRESFAELVGLYQRRVMALTYRYVRNREDAADLTQQTFLNAFERLHKLKKRQAFAGWLLRIAVNLAKNQVRFNATKSFTDIEETKLSTAPAAEFELDRVGRQKALREAITGLPEKQRRSVLLRIDGELSFREIGEVLGCSEASARGNYHNGLRALKEGLRR